MNEFEKVKNEQDLLLVESKKAALNDARLEVYKLIKENKKFTEEEFWGFLANSGDINE